MGTTVSIPGVTLSASSLTLSGAVTAASIQDTGLGGGVVHSDASGNFTSSTVVNADVSASAAIAGTKISPNFGSQNLVTTGAISLGTTPAAAGNVRVPNNTTAMAARNAANNADFTIISTDGVDDVIFGSSLSLGDSYLACGASHNLLLTAGGAINQLLISTSGLTVTGPVLHASGDAPAEGYATVNFSTDADHALSSSELNKRVLRVTGTITMGRSLTGAPLTAGTWYLVDNKTSQTVTIIGASGTGATVVTGTKAFVYTDGTNWY